ncbi:MAG TPA: heme exporter protein CcmB [Cyclobacteriaceae bacterium]|nr:heme exporter protein CcmB [Cyclobacteriaceae bacterium]
MLLLKEFQLELRKKSAIAGLLLYLFCTVFIYYMAFRLQLAGLSAANWSALFWITLLFTAISTVGKSFMGEHKGRDFYYYALASPQDILLAKMLYGLLICFAFSIFGFGLFSLLLGNQVNDFVIFTSTLLLVSYAFSSSLTLLAGIAARTQNGHILMAVLGLPILIGVLLMAIQLTKNCIDGIDPAASYDELTTLGAINLLTTAVSYLLFPYIWRS